MRKKTTKTKSASSKTKSPEKQLIDAILSLSDRHGLNHVFTTFLEITALCLSIELDPISKTERLFRYEEIEGGLTPEDSTAYARMCALLYMAVTICGSGAMVLGYAYVMKKAGLDYTDKVLFVAEDIDIRCVWMAYIQFCMYKIPAVVIHGNSLTMEEWSRWYTPYLTRVQPSGSVDMQQTAEEAVV